MQTGRFMGKIAIVTGGGSGIGKCLAERLSADGATVVVFDKVLSEQSETAVQIDVASEINVESAVRSVVERFGTVDMLANCAGISRRAPVLETSLESWNAVMAVNVTGTFLVSREAAKAMAKSGGGAIVNISSIDGHAADPEFASYNASKSAVHGLTRSFAIELASVGVRVNSVSPGYVLTPMVAKCSLSPTILKHVQENFARVPMRRPVRPDEVANAVAYLLSDDSSGVTGTDLIIDGGMMADSYLMSYLNALRD